LEALVFDEDADLRGLMTTRRTFLDRELAMLYDVQAPSLEGFESLELDPEGKRGGLLGQASILALNSHPTSSSPTLRGKFVREVLLCQSIPAPPAGVDTSIPPPTAEAATLRDRVLEHLANPSCAVCHELTDPIGLALENFDGIGRFRTLDGGAPIDSSGEFDGAAFEGPVDLAEAIVEHEDFVPCIVETLTRYATGSHEMEGSTEGLDWLSGEFQYDRYRTQALVEDLVTSPLFLQAGTVEDPGE